MFRIASVVVLLLVCGHVSAQDDVLYDSVQSVLITASKIDEIELKSKSVDSPSDLVQSLDKISGIQLQSNGPGLLSTALIHGFGARHTAILWNEFNIQSPINGTFDLSLITGFDKVSYVDQSLGSYMGTASLGGAIVLDQINNATSSEIGFNYSSIKNLRTRFSHSFKIGNLSSNVQTSYTQNQNSFRYKWGGEVNTWLTNLDGYDIKWNNHFRINDQISVDGNVWLQQFEREIPSSLASVRSFANQVDNNNRYNTSIIYSNDDYEAKLSYANFFEKLNYLTTSVDSKAKNRVDALNLSISKAQHLFNLSQRRDRADASFFSDMHVRQLSTFSYRYLQQWTTSTKSYISIAEELYDGTWSPLIFNATTRYSAGKFVASVSFGRAYNTPTFNDLYWPQGGNPDLLPELSHNVDFDFDYIVSNKFRFSIAPFYRNVANWILWSPGGQFWSPKNQRKVISKGLDFDIKFSLTSNLKLDFGTSITNTKIGEELTFKELVGKQLIYIPKVKSNISINYLKNGFCLKPEFLLVSKRYISTDNEAALPAYVLLNFELEKEVKLQQDSKLSLGLRAVNLFNTDYQQVQFYPMPLRYFELSINYKIDRK